MKTLLYVLGGVVVVGGAAFGISKLTSTPSTTSTPVVDQSVVTNQTSLTTPVANNSSGDFGNCNLSGQSSVTVVGAGVGIKDTTLTIQGGKAIETKTIAGKDMPIDRTTSVCAGWVDSFKSSMTYNSLSSAYNPKGINTNGVWFSMTGNIAQSETNLKEITENGKAVLVMETRSTISGKPGYISIF